MPNYCSYEMHVKGKKEACMELREIMVDYNLPKHFWRVFEADIVDEKGTEEDYTICITGYCAWSVYSCMFKGANTYATAYAKDNPEYKSIATSLIEESERLNLEIEVYSEECGMAFMEHYHIKNGEVLVNECVAWGEYYYDEDEYDTFEEWAEDMGLEGITEDDLEEDMYYHVGGLEWNFSF